jgi:erythromycin esterase-like protein
MEKEQSFGREKDPEQELIGLLKEKGIDNPEVRDLLQNWTIENEKIVEQSDDPQTELIWLNLKRARLYFEAGFTNEAFENYEDARLLAWNLRNNKLYEAIMQEMDQKDSL